MQDQKCYLWLQMDFEELFNSWFRFVYVKFRLEVNFFFLIIIITIITKIWQWCNLLIYLV